MRWDGLVLQVACGVPARGGREGWGRAGWRRGAAGGRRDGFVPFSDPFRGARGLVGDAEGLRADTVESAWGRFLNQNLYEGSRSRGFGCGQSVQVA